MANTLTNLTRTMLEDTVLPALKLALVPIDAFSVKLMDKPMAVGDSTQVPIATAKSAGTYSSTFETGDSTVTSQSVTMAAPTFSSWYVNPQLEAMPTAERFLAQGVEAAYAVAKSVLQDVIGLFLAANIGDVAGTDKLVQTAANYDVDDQAVLWQYIKTKGVNSTRAAINTVEYAAALLQDPALKDRSASGSDMLMTGELPSILGVRQYYTDAFPTAITNQNTGVIYTGKETAAIALTVPNTVEEGLEQASGVRIEQITDPDTGLSMIWRTWMNSATGVYWGSVYVMHGQSFIQDAAVRIVSA